MKKELAAHATFTVSCGLQTSWVCAGDGARAAGPASEGAARPSRGWNQSSGHINRAAASRGSASG